MTFTDKIALSWSNLGRRKVRTLLTSVGVVVGITTVVTMISLVNGVQLQVKTQFEKIGLDRVVVRPAGESLFSGGGFGGGMEDFGGFNPFGGGRSSLITAADVKRWQAWPETVAVTPEIELPTGLASGLSWRGHTIPIRIGGNSSPRRSAFAQALTPMFGTLDLPSSRGNIVVSRGALEALKLSTDDFRALVGQSIEILLAAPRGERQSYQLKIIGISSDFKRGVDISTPERLAMKSWWRNDKGVLKKEGYDSVTLRAADVTQAKALVKRLRKEKLTVQSIDAILDVADRIFAVITAMLALVSSVALFVACIGIVNTMIMSIYERTREIGTLKAMGASRGDIRVMFMMEAGLIGWMGGVIGVFSSYFLGRGLNRIAAFFAIRRNLPLPENLFIITPGLALSALGFATLIGIVAGLYPANRAARLNPLMALRQE